MSMKGVDVRGDKGAIDWRRVRAAGFEFAILKATEGRTFDDARFGFNRRAAKAAGLVVGAYHFARPDNNTPEAEVQHFLRVARPTRGELIPALDWETNPPTAAWAVRFLHALENEIGTPPIFLSVPGLPAAREPLQRPAALPALVLAVRAERRPAASGEP